MAKRKKTTEKELEQYEHTDKERLNNPPAGLVHAEDETRQKNKTYTYDPHLDPQLQWAGKAEHTSFEVPTVNLHVHERIDPKRIIETVKKKKEAKQGSLFEQMERPMREAVEFYRHRDGWTNRLVAGDSLLVMNSLLEKEGMAEKVQMVYFDPPYGIKYGSNFQPFTNKRDVKDGKDDDLTTEPEMIKAFRDTWELGIHSYLTYMRDRLLLARELLAESGSIFVQISDENVHHVRELLDEVFGKENFVSMISYVTSSGFTTNTLSRNGDRIIWYAKDKNQVKFRRLFFTKELPVNDANYKYLELENGVRRLMTKEERKNPYLHPINSKIYRLGDTTSQGGNNQNQEFEFQGKVFEPSFNRHWSIGVNGMKVQKMENRLEETGKSISYIRYFKDFPYQQLTDIWIDTGTGGDYKIYAVQTNQKVIERCLLMSTDPGDLVLDITCGSGTTAYVAEQWGRRWVTCDTSRVAVTLAKQRLMTATFDYYKLMHPTEGIGSGLQYQTVPHITLGSIANNPEIEPIYNKHQPRVEKALAELNEALFGGEGLVASGEDSDEGLVASGEDSDEGLVASGEDSDEGLVASGEDSDEGLVASGEKTNHSSLTTNHSKNHSSLTTNHSKNHSSLTTNHSKKHQPLTTNHSKKHYKEWEVPFEEDEKWNKEQKDKFKKFRVAVQNRQKEIDDSIARNAPQETLYDKPLVDKKKIRVTGPFTVEAVPSPTAKSLEEIEQDEAIGVSDDSVARSGETQRMNQWRQELQRTGIRAKDGQKIMFSRVEPLEGTRHIQAEAETKEDVPKTVYISFGHEFSPYDRLMVERTVMEASHIVPKPDIVVFAAFEFTAEAIKEIEETNWRNIQLLKVQMNADLFTDDLKKKRSSNESFWLIGSPDVSVFSGEFLVASGEKRVASGEKRVVSGEKRVVSGEGRVVSGEKRVVSGEGRVERNNNQIIGNYDKIKIVSGFDSLAEINQLDKTDLFVYAAISQNRSLWADFTNAKGERFDSKQHSGGTSEEFDRRIYSVSGNIQRLISRIGDTIRDFKRTKFSDGGNIQQFIDAMRRDKQTSQRLNQIIKSETTNHSPLTTQHYYQVEVNGFDYYDPKKGTVNSGGKKNIAVWMLDTSYDGRSLFPDQVFFPMSGKKDGWSRLAKNLKAEIDEEKIESYRGTVSLPFTPEGNQIAVKIVDDRGIESLKIIKI